MHPASSVLRHMPWPPPTTSRLRSRPSGSAARGSASSGGLLRASRSPGCSTRQGSARSSACRGGVDARSTSSSSPRRPTRATRFPGGTGARSSGACGGCRCAPTTAGSQPPAHSSSRASRAATSACSSVARRTSASGPIWPRSRRRRSPQGRTRRLDALLVAVAAHLAVRWTVGRDATVPGVLYTIERLPALALSAHPVLRVPRCGACSQAATLAPQTSLARSGGRVISALPPGLGRAVSPYTGIVRSLEESLCTTAEPAIFRAVVRGRPRRRAARSAAGSSGRNRRHRAQPRGRRGRGRRRGARALFGNVDPARAAGRGERPRARRGGRRTRAVRPVLRAAVRRSTLPVPPLHPRVPDRLGRRDDGARP